MSPILLYQGILIQLLKIDAKNFSLGFIGLSLVRKHLGVIAEKSILILLATYVNKGK